MNVRTIRIGVGGTLCALIVALAGSVPAGAQSVQKICGDEWTAAKKSGKVPAGQAWPGFLSECRKRHTAAAAKPSTPAPTPAAAPSVPAKPPVPTPTAAPVTPPKPAAPAATPTAENPTQACRDEYDAAKKAGAVPKGTNYFRYLSECRKRRTAGATPSATPPTTATQPTTNTAPPPAAATTAAPAPAPSTKPATPTAAPAPAGTKTSPGGGREAFIARERQCGARWKAIKGTPALPAGITTWPKYWHYCSDRLKQNLPI